MIDVTNKTNTFIFKILHKKYKKFWWSEHQAYYCTMNQNINLLKHSSYGKKKKNCQKTGGKNKKHVSYLHGIYYLVSINLNSHISTSKSYHMALWLLCTVDDDDFDQWLIKNQ